MIYNVVLVSGDSDAYMNFRCSDTYMNFKASACNAGEQGSIPGLGRSPGEGNGNPLQYSCLVNPMDGGAWWATVHGVAKSRIRLNDFTSSKVRSSQHTTFTLARTLSYGRESLGPRL